MNNIYGVDIDPQAVEVTKLSLLLKVLEGEGVAAQMSFLPERVLPDLGRNIKCGNSLIGPEFLRRQARSAGRGDGGPGERVRLGAEFPEALAAGGFDAVIGNPPYIRIQALQEWAPLEVEHYKRAYRAASKGNYDIYVVFVEKGLRLLNEHGVLGFILPHKFFNARIRSSRCGSCCPKATPEQSGAFRRSAGVRARGDLHLPAVSGEGRAQGVPVRAAEPKPAEPRRALRLEQ